MKNKISFDFDDTLSFPDLQNYAKELIGRGFEVWIVTSRYQDTTRYGFDIPKSSIGHKDLYKVANELGIPKEHITFTNFVEKSSFFEYDSNFICHLDDNSSEIALINRNTKVRGVDISVPGWKSKCETILK